MQACQGGHALASTMGPVPKGKVRPIQFAASDDILPHPPQVGGEGTELQGQPACTSIYIAPGILQGLFPAGGWLSIDLVPHADE